MWNCATQFETDLNDSNRKMLAKTHFNHKHTCQNLQKKNHQITTNKIYNSKNISTKGKIENLFLIVLIV